MSRLLGYRGLKGNSAMLFFSIVVQLSALRLGEHYGRDRTQNATHPRARNKEPRQAQDAPIQIATARKRAHLGSISRGGHGDSPEGALTEIVSIEIV